ncbi:unnamed protein product [Microthlaspi erraticum]|uniref:Uncharacterized protein n=1 Tax=Microthlaspi erraticum TaxID=1685480 RepID=A0A6D2J0Y2_9BRAS|nr:unnamed protein product [Microthlaspi erraticum]
MDGYDPYYHETKKAYNQIESVRLLSEFGVGFVMWCPCGDALAEQFLEGEKYWMCEKWDTAVTKEIERLKEQNEIREKKVKVLGIQLEETQKKLGKEIESRANVVREVYDMIMDVVCGCDECKSKVKTALNMHL